MKKCLFIVVMLGFLLIGCATQPGPVQPSKPSPSIPTSPSNRYGTNEYGCLIPLTPERIKQHCTIQSKLRNMPTGTDCVFLGGTIENYHDQTQKNHTFDIMIRQPTKLPSPKPTIEELGESAQRDVKAHLLLRQIYEIIDVPYTVEPGLGENAVSIKYQKETQDFAGSYLSGFALFVIQGGHRYEMFVDSYSFGDNKATDSCTIEGAKNLLKEVIAACESGETSYCAKYF